MVSSASNNCLAVEASTLKKSRGFMPRMTADRIATMRHEVPEAPSQLNEYTAPYAVGWATTGATC